MLPYVRDDGSIESVTDLKGMSGEDQEALVAQVAARYALGITHDDLTLESLCHRCGHLNTARMNSSWFPLATRHLSSKWMHCNSCGRELGKPRKLVERYI